MTKGRIELGIGAGTFWKAIGSYGGPSRTASEAVAALEEAIQVIRLIWNPDKTNKRKTVSFEGKFYQLQEAHPGPAPYYPVKIWIGAQGPKMLNLIGRLGDGWSIPLQSYLQTERIDGAQKIIDEAARANGRNPDSIRRIRGLAGIIDQENRLEKSLHGQGETVVGSAGVWVDELIFNAKNHGVDSFVFWPASEGNELEQIRLFAEKVVPQFKEKLKSSC
ncbi:MAG: LLM class flavin-dependent oxidoreductase [archaeon]|nr:LLM class flavin-dependent oxidoreductase [archaeon]